MNDALQDRPERWPVDASQTVFGGAIISVRQDTVRSPVDGATFTRDVVVHPGAVAIVALDEQERVLVISQYRHPVGYRLYELPAGLRDVDGEPSLQAAQRELYEEGHVRARDWRVLTDIFSSPGTMDEAVRIYLARGITEVAYGERYNGIHEEADMPVSWQPLPRLVDAALAGRIQNAIVCVGALAAWAASHDGGYDALRRPDAPWQAVDGAPDGTQNGAPDGTRIGPQNGRQNGAPDMPGGTAGG
ncbi:NUDIX hydrolase [Actinobacteria bacterium YIM 96077]|uniref:ADP-ribose pyrophosphatase n=1 Tax=Phytoactinopolyspora halophila TaxID=1981511 RepID=A0A329QGA2_9ACTN|nr:NUDIX hydrolase [Phytoactinopolyspora halophila]AYY13605.1 NUDIX hydrolase [Actinobacteria bacterium YIM 96077]RAW10729.1 ADP-ribose pyrophosphatase [Phytoactinopolyspora halophila]